MSRIYIDVSDEINKNNEFQKLKDKLNNFIKSEEETSFIIDHPLSKKKYDFLGGFLILIPGYKIIFSSIKSIDSDDFMNFYDDLIEELSSLSIKYNYKDVLGYSRQWKNQLLSKKNIQEINFKDERLSIEDRRKVNMLISLLTGSINDIKKIGPDTPNNILQAVKKRIILFDADQTRFIYDDLNKKQINIQGLAGTGKTELLLHKLYDLYDSQENIKIVFTCFNTVLANKMPDRILNFFNFMKSEKQLEWNKKIWAMRSWGSKSDPNSGVYSFVCNYYNLSFSRYYQGIDFNDLCQKVLDQLNDMDDFQCCFDYILIDEGQDFGDNFFKLCEKITNKQVIIASDIYQNIFDKESQVINSPDYILNKVYRTDPKNFMFAQMLGFGVEEDKVINWPSDIAWKDCGYLINKKEDNYIFTREPLKRFPDIKNNPFSPIELTIEDEDNIVNSVISIIKNLCKNDINIAADDIAIVILASSYKRLSKIADEIAFEVADKFDWSSQKAYEQKENSTDKKLFISNKNNIKGLEFPFVICIADSLIESNLSDRNAIYMSLTRSFITSYLILNKSNEDIYHYYLPLLDEIKEKGTATIKKPSQDKILNRRQINDLRSKLTLEQSIESILSEYGSFSREKLGQIKEACKVFCGDKIPNNSQLKSIINFTLKMDKGYEK